MAIRHADYLTDVDLNLLRALQALLLERHVGKAARRLGTSQPAMSRALAKLRVTFADEILVRVGQTMQPTPRGLGLLGPLEEVLGRVRELVAGNRFDPQTATGSIRIAALDILTYMLLPKLLNLLAKEAPHLDIQVVQWSHRWREHLESGDVDITVGQPTGQEAGEFRAIEHLRTESIAMAALGGLPVGGEVASGDASERLYVLELARLGPHGIQGYRAYEQHAEPVMRRFGYHVERVLAADAVTGLPFAPDLAKIAYFDRRDGMDRLHQDPAHELIERELYPAAVAESIWVVARAQHVSSQRQPDMPRSSSPS
jgi:DNA-binding transcriptional LysR family regulator